MKYGNQWGSYLELNCPFPAGCQYQGWLSVCRFEKWSPSIVDWQPENQNTKTIRHVWKIARQTVLDTAYSIKMNYLTDDGSPLLTGRTRWCHTGF